MSLFVRELWRYDAGENCWNTAITADRRVVVSTSIGHIRCLDSSGALVWERTLEGSAFSLALADTGQRILVGNSVGKQVGLFDYTGHIVKILGYEEAAVAVGAAPDASILMVGSFDKHLYAYDCNGELLWKRHVGGVCRKLSVSRDGRRVALGTHGGSILLVDHRGNQLWSYKAGSSIYADVIISTSGEYVFAGSNDKLLYCFDIDGRLVWKRDIDGFANVVALSDEGGFVAVATNRGTVYLYDYAGGLVWQHQAGNDVYGLTFSRDGRFLGITAYDDHIYLLDQEYNNLWHQQTNGKPYGISITPDGQLFVVASRDGFVHLFENLAAYKDDQDRHAWGMSWQGRALIRQIRREFLDNPQLGIARGFESFDAALRRGEFALCMALLNELREGHYDLSVDELAFVDSREGALLLCRGIRQHWQGNFAEARRNYEQSRAIHQRVRNTDGEGQALAALATLEDEQGDNSELLVRITNKPLVLGSSDTFLVGRVRHGTPAEQFQVVTASTQLGILMPILEALEAAETAVRSTAAAALARLEPGPTNEQLLQLLSSHVWFVRWQAVMLLQHRLEEYPQGRDAYIGIFHDAISRMCDGYEGDPEVRREIAHLLRFFGDTATPQQLVSLLTDQDADVRMAAVDALEAVGDRRALSAIQDMPDGVDFWGKSILERATEVAHSIEQRHPLPTIREIIFHVGEIIEGGAIHPATLFLPSQNLLHCIVELSEPGYGAGLTCRWYMDQQLVAQQEGITSTASIHHFARHERLLVELLNHAA